MLRSFADEGTADIYNGVDSKRARRILPSSLHALARRKLDWLHTARSLNDLKAPPSNRLEALKGDLAGRWSIRINAQYRIVFRWEHEEAHAAQVTDYHK